MNLIIVGATGLVGTSFINLLKNFDTSFYKISLVASNNSEGKVIKVNDDSFIVETLDEVKEYLDKNEYSIFINCSSKAVAVEINTILKTQKGIMIDNSSKYRMDKNIPLIVPHINMDSFMNQKIIANPNCSTIILSCLLNPLKHLGLKRLVVSTYQAVSGAGKIGINELNQQIINYSKGYNIESNVFKYQALNNCFVHDSPKLENGYSEEELKMVNETSKIFNDIIPLSCTCIRVPVMRSHCLSVNIEFKNEVSYDDIIMLLKNDKEIIVVEEGEPTSLSSTLSEKVYVGHIRKDFSQINTFNFFISGDQILRGASYNAFMILKNLDNQLRGLVNSHM